MPSMLPQSLAGMSSGNLRDFYAMQAADALSQEVDPSQFIEESRRQREEGQSAMLNSLAAQYAGRGFEPLQGMMLRKALASQDPLQVGNAGYINSKGQFIKTPGHDQARRAQLSQTMSQLFGQRQAEETAATYHREDRQDRRDAQTPYSLVADPVNGGLLKLNQHSGAVGPADGMPVAPGGRQNPNAPTGFQGMPSGLKIPEASTKNFLGASMLAEHLPQLEDLVFKQGYSPTNMDKFAAGPQLPGWQSTVQSVTPNTWADPKAQKFYNIGSKILTAILRPESGGAITADEWTQYGPMYLPWPGNPPEVRQQKMQNLRAVMNRLAAGSGPAGRYFSPPAEADTGEQIIDLPPRGRP